MQLWGGRTLITLAATVGVNPAEAALLFTLTEVGSDVVLEGSGTVDLAGLSPFGTTSGAVECQINPNGPFVFAGTTSVGYVVFDGATSAQTFGSGNTTIADSHVGSWFGVGGSAVAVPTGYVSGDPLSSQSTFNNSDFATLGVTKGTYTWTWGSGANADSATLTVGSTAAVPEPMTILGTFTALGFGAAFKRRQAKS